jgi:hypothetical protein|tara:strand:- start:12 stop:266 length:255 start_codon:yes stop_codon:yes gene_type:complete
MSNSRELSDLKLTREECPKCGATWINGNHVWTGTGNDGNELDLAGLVCNKLGDETCINPMKGFDGGQTWEKRLGTLEKLQEEDL